MSKVWKWILGIILILVVVAAVVAVPLVMRNRMLTFNTTTNSLPQQSQQPQQTPGPGVNNGGPMMRGYNGGPMMRGNNGFQRQPMPGMRGGFGFQPEPGRGFNNRFSPFGFGFMFFGGLLRLIPLALFALLLFGVYQLGKRSGMRSIQAPAPAPVSTQSAAPTASESEINETPSI